MAIVNFYCYDTASPLISQDFWLFTLYWEKLRFSQYNDLLDQPYNIFRKIQYYNQAQALGDKKRQALKK